MLKPLLLINKMFLKFEFQSLKKQSIRMSSFTEIIHLSFSCANANVALIIEEKVELSIDMVSFCTIRLVFLQLKQIQVWIKITIEEIFDFLSFLVKYNFIKN